MGTRTRDSITARHTRQCPAFDSADARCSCEPTYQAQVWSRSEKKRITRTFPTYAAAKNWRDDARVEIRRGTLVIGEAPTLRAAWTECHELMCAGVLRTRSGDPYKPSTIRAYENAMDERLLEAIGPIRLNEIRTPLLQRLVEGWQKDGLAAQTIHNTLIPLRVVFKRAVRLNVVTVNPTKGVELPASKGKRDRFATPAEAAQLVGLVPDEDQALWATAFYCGLRRGELLALDWEHDVDLDTNTIEVENGWDLDEGGRVAPKSAAGRRTIPIVKQLRPYLLRHALLTGRRTGLVFGRDADRPFTPGWIQKRADRAWAAAEKKRKKAIDDGELGGVKKPIRRVTFHDCRHTFASLMIQAQVASGRFNPKALQELMGHSSIQITYDRYGHLFPGTAAEAGQALEQYLDAASS